MARETQSWVKTRLSLSAAGDWVEKQVTVCLKEQEQFKDRDVVGEDGGLMPWWKKQWHWASRGCMRRRDEMKLRVRVQDWITGRMGGWCDIRG